MRVAPWAGMIAMIAAEGVAQVVTIDQADSRGSLTFWGGQIGSTAEVEWASDFEGTNGTQWYTLGEVVVTNDRTSAEIPTSFRVRGVPYTNLENGLVAHFRLDGNSQDSSTNQIAATLSGATGADDRFGAPGRALAFDGINDRLTSDSSLLRPSNISVSIWFATQSTNAETLTAPALIRNRLYGYGVNLNIVAGTGGSELSLPGALVMSLWNSTTTRYQYVSAETNYNSGAWHHACFTYGEGGFRAYVDGGLRFADSQYGTGSAYYQPGGFAIGRDGNNPNNYSSGRLDDVRIYSRELDSNDVFRLYAMPSWAASFLP